jgi:hypothetical protein
MEVQAAVEFVSTFTSQQSAFGKSLPCEFEN